MFSSSRYRRVIGGLVAASAFLVGPSIVAASSTTAETTGTTAGSDDSATATAATTGAPLADGALSDLLPDDITEAGVLRFGALWETPPTIGVDPSDTTVPVGFAPDMAVEMERLLGVDIEWENMQWPAQLPGVQSGAVDALFGQVTITEEREQSIVDLIPFGQQAEGLLLPADNPEELTRLGDACGLTIGVPVGSTQSELVAQVSEAACTSKGEPAIEMAEYQGAAAAISALRAGTIDGWLNTILNQEAVINAEGGDAFTAIQLPDDEKAPTLSGIAVSKSQPGVSEAIAAAMKALIDDGTYGELLDKWELGPAAITADQVVINPLTGTAVGEVAD